MTIREDFLVTLEVNTFFEVGMLSLNSMLVGSDSPMTVMSAKSELDIDFAWAVAVLL